MKTSTTGFRFPKARALRWELRIAVLVGWFLAVVSTAQTYEVLHRFRNSEASQRPVPAPSQSRLIVAPDGYLYGTTYWGGTSGFGTAYRIESDGTATSLHSFAFADGANPAAGLVLSSDGSFYGTTDLGGIHNAGTLFRMDPSGAVTQLHSFDGNGGAHPLAGLIQASDGKLYGTTSEGGANGVGVVFRIAAPAASSCCTASIGMWTAPFPSRSSSRPAVRFTGTTKEGGANNLGTVFRMDLGGSVSTVRAFAGADGSYPVAPLIPSTSGDLYGNDSSSGHVYRGRHLQTR